MERSVTVKAEPVDVVHALGAEPSRREYAISINYTGERYASARRAKRVAKAIEKAIIRTVKTV